MNCLALLFSVFFFWHHWPMHAWSIRRRQWRLLLLYIPWLSLIQLCNYIYRHLHRDQDILYSLNRLLDVVCLYFIFSIRLTWNMNTFCFGLILKKCEKVWKFWSDVASMSIFICKIWIQFYILKMIFLQFYAFDV